MNIIFKTSQKELNDSRDIIKLVLAMFGINSSDIEYILNTGGLTEKEGWSIDIYENEEDDDIVFDILMDKNMLDNGINATEKIMKNPLAMKAIMAAFKMVKSIK